MSGHGIRVGGTGDAEPIVTPNVVPGTGPQTQEVFWFERVDPRTAIACGATFGVFLIAVIQAVKGTPMVVPDWLILGIGSIWGFYFGNKKVD